MYQKEFFFYYLLIDDLIVIQTDTPEAKLQIHSVITVIYCKTNKRMVSWISETTKLFSFMVFQV